MKKLIIILFYGFTLNAQSELKGAIAENGYILEATQNFDRTFVKGQFRNFEDPAMALLVGYNYVKQRNVQMGISLGINSNDRFTGDITLDILLIKNLFLSTSYDYERWVNVGLKFQIGKARECNCNWKR